MVSIAIPSSCIRRKTCSTLQEQTYTLHQISRACVLFGIEEIVVYDVPGPEQSENAEASAEVGVPKKVRLDGEETPEVKKVAKPLNENEDLITTANMLQYFITPRHLRKTIFKSLAHRGQFKVAEKLPPVPGLIERKNVALGVAVPRARKRRAVGQRKLSKKERKDATVTPYINLGFNRLFKLRNSTAPVNSRVFVNFAKGEVVEAPRNGAGSGYSVRAVSQFSHIFTQSPLPDGYGQSVCVPSQQFKGSAGAPLMKATKPEDVGDREKLLLVFGGWKEIQHAVSSDPDMALDDAAALFDGVFVGVEHSRLEDSVMVSLARM